MAIADTINSIREHLTADYESLENIGAELENVDKNIENIASVVNGIYDNLPKTTGESSNLSLTTLKGKMNIIPKGDTSQDGTPTPSTPIDIEVVTGTQEVKVENKNLCKNAIVNATSSAYVDILYVDMDLKPNTTYTISFIGATNNKIYLNENITTPQYITCNGSRQSLTFTTKSSLDKNNSQQYKPSANGWILFKNNSSNTETPSFDNVQIEYGSTATPYTPHQEQTQTISLASKNLLDCSTIQQKTMGGITCSYNSETQVITFNGTCDTDNTLFKFIGTSFTPIANTSTLSVHYVSGSVTNYCRIRFFTSTFGGNINFDLDSLSDSTPIIAVTSTGNTELTENSIRFNNGSVANNFKIKVMFANSTNTTYEEYYNIELCKIGNYQDYLYKSNDKWYKKENVGKYIFTGNETIDQFSSRTNTIRFSIANVLPTTLVAQEYNYNAYCNYLKAQDIYNNDVQGFFTHFNGSSATRIYIGLDKTIASTSEQAKTWLGNVKPILYYQLRTPSDIEITDTNLVQQLENMAKLYSYNGTTNISSSGSLPMIIKARALKGE